MMDYGPFLLSILKAGDRCGDGGDPDRENGFPDQAVEEGTLSGLKLAQDSYINWLILAKQTFTGFNLPVQGGDVKLSRDLLNPD